MVFQEYAIFTTMNAYENIAFGLRVRKVPKKQIEREVLGIAASLNIGDALYRNINKLNLSELQRVALARTLSTKPSLMLLDEPLSNLDAALRERTRVELKHFHDRWGITMIYVTHDQLEASTFADKIAVMYDGQVVQFGTPRELFEKPAHTFVGYFIGSPGMNFMSVTHRAGNVMFGDLPLPVNEAISRSVAASSSSNIKLGIRPEFISVSQTPGADSVPIEVVNLQDLGTYSLLSFTLNGQLFKARLPEGHAPIGDAAHATFSDQHIALYVDEYLVEIGHE
jgi:glycerol transport system ATP-binding protein